MRRYFVQLFWGMLLASVVFDFLFDNFLLFLFYHYICYMIAAAGIVGLLLTSASCDGLSTLSPKFAKAAEYCKYLILLFVVAQLALQLDEMLKINNPFIRPISISICVLISPCLKYLLVKNLYGGVCDYAESEDLEMIAKDARNSVSSYGILMGITFCKPVLLGMYFVVPSLLGLVLGLVWVLMILFSPLVMIGMLDLIFRLRNQWPTDGTLGANLPASKHEKADVL